MKVDKTKKTILMYQPDRYFKKTDSKVVDAYFEEHVPCNFLVALTWEDFVAKLDFNPDLVGFHCDLVNHDQFRIFELIKGLEITLQLKNKQADIFVTANQETSKEVINKLRKTSIKGIQFGRRWHGIEKACESWQNLLFKQSSWPEDLIAPLPEISSNKKPLVVYFHNDTNLEEDINFRRDHEELKSWSPCTLRVCKSWSDLSLIIEESPQSIVFHIDMVKRHSGTIPEFMLMLETMIKYANIKVRPNVGVVIEADTHLLTVKELQKHKIHAIIPNARWVGLEYSKKAVMALLDNESFYPKEIIGQLPGNEQKAKNKNNNALTIRQQEVFELIANRGLSNKQIARVLNISESTVKIHVSAVMKNLCVRNRTQLALTK